MARISDRLEALVDQLTAAGVQATTDPRDIQIPGAWVTLHDITDPVLCGDYNVRAAICLLATDNSSPLALDALGDMLDKIVDIVAVDEPVTPTTVTPPGAAPIPALVIITTTH